FDNAPRSGAAFVVEAGEQIRFANNVVQGYASGLLIFGTPPRTRAVIAANNLLLGVSDTAVKLDDAAGVPLLDHNVLSPAGAASVEIGGRTLPLVRWLKEVALPHSRMVPG